MCFSSNFLQHSKWKFKLNIRNLQQISSSTLVIDNMSHLLMASDTSSEFSHVRKNEIRGNESDRSMARWKEVAAEDSG